MFSYYVDDVSWHSFTTPEQRIIAKTAQAFAKSLRVAGFMPGERNGGNTGEVTP